MTIGNRIGEERRKKNLSQEYIAESLGVSRQAVSKWETDQSSPDTANLIALSELLGVSVEYLATGKSAVEPKAEKPTYGAAKICGFIFLGAGLLSLVLGVLFSEVLILLSFAMIIIGLLCVCVKRHLGAILAIVLAVPIFVYFTVFMPRDYKFMSALSGTFFWTVSAVLIALALFALFWIKRKKK